MNKEMEQSTANAGMRSISAQDVAASATFVK